MKKAIKILIMLFCVLIVPLVSAGDTKKNHAGYTLNPSIVLPTSALGSFYIRMVHEFKNEFTGGRPSFTSKEIPVIVALVTIVASPLIVPPFYAIGRYINNLKVQYHEIKSL